MVCYTYFFKALECKQVDLPMAIIYGIMSDKGLKKYSGDNHQDGDRSAPYPVSRMAPATELVDLARQIEEADQMLGNVVHGKLKVIADQMKSLQQEAKAILAASARDQQLHRAQCRFKREPGKIYHLYKRSEDAFYFSMLSPKEWGGAPPHAFVGSFRLENDMSWTPLEEIGKDETSIQLLNTMLSTPSR